MDFTDDAIVLSTRRHGESDAILSALTREHGRHMGLIKGGASRRQRPVLEIGNRLRVHWRARLEEQLGNYQVEAAGSGGGSVSAGLFDDPLRLAALASACAVVDLVLPEREPHEDVFDATTLLIGGITSEDRATPHPNPLPQGEREQIAKIDAAASPLPSEREGQGEGSKTLSRPALWPAAYVHWELQLLTALGFGLDLSHCAATGETRDLTYVSPKTGRAVSREAALPYADRLLALPPFLIEPDAAPDIADLLAGLRLTGYFLDRHVLHGPNTDRRLEARARFIERLSAQP
jgi:DNA repair protein RecO (recombination protein O)